MIDQYIEQLKEKSSEVKFKKKELKKWQNKQEKCFLKLEDLEAAKTIIQKATQITQQQLSKQISSIVSKALAAVFLDDPYKFKADFVTRRNTTECDLLFEKNGKTKKPLDSCGYGAADIASLALRVVYWKLDGTVRNTLILDEPTRNLDTKKQVLASLMIKKLSQMKGGLQFLIITHKMPLSKSADRVFEVTKENNFTKVERIK